MAGSNEGFFQTAIKFTDDVFFAIDRDDDG
jgi:hypothetical protein